MNTALAITLAMLVFVAFRGLSDVKLRLRWDRADVVRAISSLLAFMAVAIPFGLATETRSIGAPKVSSRAFLRGSVRTNLPVEPISLRPAKVRRSVLRAGSDRYEYVRPVQGSGATSTRGSLSIPFRRPFRYLSNQRRASGRTLSSSPAGSGAGACPKSPR